MEKKFEKGDKVTFWNGILKEEGTVFKANKTNVRVQTALGRIITVKKDKLSHKEV